MQRVKVEARGENMALSAEWIFLDLADWLYRQMVADSETPSVAETEPTEDL